MLVNNFEKLNQKLAVKFMLGLHVGECAECKVKTELMLGKSVWQGLSLAAKH